MSTKKTNVTHGKAAEREMRSMEKSAAKSSPSSKRASGDKLVRHLDREAEARRDGKARR